MIRSAASLSRRVDELARLCRERGMNVTPQRLTIYRALLEAEDHPSPEAVYHRVRPGMPSLSLATVYKTLEALEALGLVREVPVSGPSKRYDANLEKHHHLVCTRCGRIADLYDPGFDRIPAPRKLEGFVVQSISVEVAGLCGRCARKGG